MERAEERVGEFEDKLAKRLIEVNCSQNLL